MVAFATDYEPETATVEPENRFGNFFVDVSERAGLTGSATRTVAGGNDRFSYDACRSVSLAQVGDPSDPHGFAVMRDAYLESLRVQNYSERTVENRISYLNALIIW